MPSANCQCETTHLNWFSFNFKALLMKNTHQPVLFESSSVGPQQGKPGSMRGRLWPATAKSGCDRARSAVHKSQLPLWSRCSLILEAGQLIRAWGRNRIYECLCVKLVHSSTRLCGRAYEKALSLLYKFIIK